MGTPRDTHPLTESPSHPALGSLHMKRGGGLCAPPPLGCSQGTEVSQPAPGGCSASQERSARCGGGVMGVPAAPLKLLLLLLLLLCPVTPTTPRSPCLAVPTGDSQDLDLSNKTHGCAELDLGPFRQKRRLWLSHNGIEALSPSSQLGPQLEELDLGYNRLRELPEGLFAHATALRTLRLEGNPLPAVPPAAFQPSLSSLSVSCRCDVVGTVLAPCARTAARCRCLMSRHEFLNVTEFYDRECGASAGLVGGLAGAGAAVATLVAVGAALVCYRRRRAGAAVAGAGWGKQDPGAGTRQPRYISRDTGSGTNEVTDAPDYENVFVSPGTAPATAQGWAPAWQEQRYQPQVPEDENYFLEREADPGDQPIYANTLGPSEDVYIIPDH
ncbi:leucine-rich repeat-containing protein 25-like [Myiozetetes cayanensis]|uniref:leucine-rich repeat-containing protein 25-like n=1 Tax=Myiozetetes cayanensis TaxID=478635 RepID=UPI0021604DC6|nr:leucine-rich repeat-containing protein 25-like [Myiozetetes cayanensis]